MFWIAWALAAPIEAHTAYVPGGGFQLESDDGRFGFAVKSRIQLLETVEAVGAGPVTQGFTLRRVRLALSGFGFGSWNRWGMQLGFSDSDRAPPARSPLLDLYWQLAPDAPVELMVGQFKVPLGRARISSTSTLQFVDRHALDSEFAMDRDRGAVVTVRGWSPDGEKPRAAILGGVFAGNGRADGLVHDTGVAPLVRVELMPLGAFRFHTDGDLERGKTLRLGLGAGVARVYQAPRTRGGVGDVPSDGGTTNMTIHTFDLAVRWRGLALEGSVAGRNGSRDAPGVLPVDIEAARNGWGWAGQGSAMLPEIPVSVAGRYTTIDPSGTSSLPRTRELAGAVSWFIAGHAYDLTADFTRLTEGSQETLRGRLQLELSL